MPERQGLEGNTGIQALRHGVVRFGRVWGGEMNSLKVMLAGCVDLENNF